MKAKEAREVAKNAAKLEIDKLILLIANEAKRGECSLSLDSISGGAYAFLKDEGYDVEITEYPINFGQIIKKINIYW